MTTLFDPSSLETLIRRLQALSPGAQAHWGTMDAPRMVCHVGDQLRAALGELPTTPRKTPFRFRLLRYLFVHLLPWPKGKLPTVREMLSTPPAAWDDDVKRVSTLFERAAAKGPRSTWPAHPAFGPLSGQEWGRIIYKHTDHHFRQFGV